MHLDFQVVKAGQLCHTVEVTGAGGVFARAQGCVTAVEAGAKPGAVAPPAAPTAQVLKVTVKRLDAQEQAVGGVVRFTVDVANLTNRPLSKVTVLAGNDSSLDPKDATDGHKRGVEGLSWTIETLPAGKAAQLEIHYNCLSAAAKACCRVTASTAEWARATDEACVTIRAPAGKPPPGTMPAGPMPPGAAAALNVTVEDLQDPISVGKIETYKIHVSNQGRSAERLVAVVVTVPDEMTPDPIGTGTEGPPFPQARISRQTVRFDPLSELRPGETMVYRVRARAVQPGKARLRVEVSSLSPQRPPVIEETTEVTR